MTGEDHGPEWRPYARALADGLEKAGIIRDRLWHQSVAETPRHLFVPLFYARADDGSHRSVGGADPAQRETWLQAVYSDETLVTQLGSVCAPERFGGRTQVVPTSSSTAPGLMLRMLEDLDVSDGSRVLEIGTGTGYNAALLCQRLGSKNVASIDIDPGLVETARARLAKIDYEPTLATGDGAKGFPDAERFDRIIATAAVSAIPPAWIEQAHQGSIILADLRSEISGGVVKLRKVDDHTLQGRYLDYPGCFMWLRSRADNPLREHDDPYGLIDKREAERRTTTTDPRLLSDKDFAFLAQLYLPCVRLFRLGPPEGEMQMHSTVDDSWAEVSPQAERDGSWTVVFGGQRDLWQAIEQADIVWKAQGPLTRERFGVTVTAKRQHVWLKTLHGRSWDLPTTP